MPARWKYRLCAALGSVMLTTAIEVRSQVIDMNIRLPLCADGSDIYAGVARRRDRGRPMESQLETPIPPPPGSSIDLSGVQTRAHNRLVREIYGHPQWTPDEVAERWQERCKTNRGKPKSKENSMIVVDTLL